MIKDKIRIKAGQANKAVIVGGGPSTMTQDWEKIRAQSKNTIFLACNRIGLIFDSTSWRPDIYTCFASSSIKRQDWIENVDRCVSEEKILSLVDSRFKNVSSLQNFHENVIFCKNIFEHYRHGPIYRDFLNVNLNKGILKSFSATVPLFQICDSLNVKSIAVIGQDGYIFEKGENHFDKKYNDEPSNYKLSNTRLKGIHEEFKRYFKPKKVKIYNSSPKSIIQDTHEFVDLADFVKEDLN